MEGEPADDMPTQTLSLQACSVGNKCDFTACYALYNIITQWKEFAARWAKINFPKLNGTY